MENLSHLPGDPIAALTGRESEAATNTVSTPAPFTPPGSVSESSSDAEAGEPGPHGTAYDGRHTTRGAPPVIRRGEWNEVP